MSESLVILPQNLPQCLGQILRRSLKPSAEAELPENERDLELLSWQHREISKMWADEGEIWADYDTSKY
jgi:hypothetical protein